MADEQAVLSEDLDEVIEIFNPQTEGVARASRRALQEVWSARGWVEKPAPVEEDLNSFTIAGLKEIAQERGIEVPSEATKKAEIIEVIETAMLPQTEQEA